MTGSVLVKNPANLTLKKRVRALFIDMQIDENLDRQESSNFAKLDNIIALVAKQRVASYWI